MLTKIYLIVASTLTVVMFSEAALAPFVTKCRSDDTECQMASTIVALPVFAAGVPELGVETLDPAYFDFVNCSKLNLKFIVSDLYIKGLKNCKPVDVHRDAPNSKMYIKLSCAVESDGQYELKGKLLALDINGHGKVHVLLRRCEVYVDLDIGQFEAEDGSKHFNIKKFKYTFDLLEKSDVVFENLFHENPSLNNAAAEVIKNSGNEVVKDISDPIFHACVTKIVKNLNNFFLAVPIEELSID